jgi:1-deoxy-D-xylulose-5-phosphate reductoisomerase
MSDVIETVMAKATFIKKPIYDDYVSTDAEARRMAEEVIANR